MKIAFAFLSLALAAGLQPRATLRDAIRQAQSLSAALKSQWLEEESAQTAALSAEKRQWFSIDLVGAYRYSSDTIALTAATFPFLDPVKTGIPPNAILASSPESTYDLKVGLAQPLYTGGMLKNSILAESARLAGERAMTQWKATEVAAKVKSSFFTFQLLQKKIDSLQFMRGALTMHLQRIEKFYREELVKKSDILETKSRIIEVDLGLQDLWQMREMEAVQFKRLTGMPADEIDPDFLEIELSFDACTKSLSQNHPFVKSMEERMRQLDFQKKIVAGAALPQVGLFAELHYGKPGMNFFKNEWRTYVQSGIGFTLPLFNWNKTSREKHLVELAREKIAVLRQDFLSECEKSLRQLFIQKQSIGAKMLLLADLVAYSEEDVAMKERLYLEKQIDHVTYLMAVSSLEKHRSQSSELQTQREMVKAGIVAVVGINPEEK